MSTHNGLHPMHAEESPQVLSGIDHPSQGQQEDLNDDWAELTPAERERRRWKLQLLMNARGATER